MILYHFTDFYYLKNGGTILTEGLKPAADNDGVWQLPPVVWLTSETEDTWSLRKAQCRITVAILSTDKRLVRFETWLRKHGKRDIIAALNKQLHPWKQHYLYFGHIPLNKCRVVEAIEYAARKGAYTVAA